MSITDIQVADELVHGDDHHEDHHEQSFIFKYIFSTDHKTIAKQFLITGIFWAILGGGLSVIFRLQLGFPDMDMGFLQPFMGEWISKSGKLYPAFYLAMITMHCTIMVFFVLMLRCGCSHRKPHRLNALQSTPVNLGVALNELCVRTASL